MKKYYNSLQFALASAPCPVRASSPNAFTILSGSGSVPKKQHNTEKEKPVTEKQARSLFIYYIVLLLQ